MAYDGHESRRTWTTFADQMCGPVLKTSLAHQKVRMSRDLYIGKHLALYIQNRDQTTITEM